MKSFVISQIYAELIYYDMRDNSAGKETFNKQFCAVSTTNSSYNSRHWSVKRTLVELYYKKSHF